MFLANNISDFEQMLQDASKHADANYEKYLVGNMQRRWTLFNYGLVLTATELRLLQDIAARKPQIEGDQNVPMHN